MQQWTRSPSLRMNCLTLLEGFLSLHSIAHNYCLFFAIGECIMRGWEVQRMNVGVFPGKKTSGKFCSGTKWADRGGGTMSGNLNPRDTILGKSTHSASLDRSLSTALRGNNALSHRAHNIPYMWASRSSDWVGSPGMERSRGHHVLSFLEGFPEGGVITGALEWTV